MAWYAKINKDNVVTQVTFTVDSKDSDWLYREYGGTWLKCNEGELRVNFPVVGYTYNKELDAFIPPKPYNSWSLNEDTCLWQSPVVPPNDNKKYRWNESLLNWEEVNAN